MLYFAAMGMGGMQLIGLFYLAMLAVSVYLAARLVFAIIRWLDRH